MVDIRVSFFFLPLSSFYPVRVLAGVCVVSEILIRTRGLPGVTELPPIARPPQNNIHTGAV